ncbi:g13221 [Coccomyxa viridis]|uniref:G13221 protein n=1 Tax=Coccomyxa viridis TaxID=1274662 RepID=A0ABP1GC84_9CHLO
MPPSSETLNGTAGIPPLQSRAEGFDQTHGFSTFANWIIPGHVMLGRYPYVEPSRCRTHEQGEEQLAQILNEGITTFICLQGEIPPQQEMRIGGVRGFVPYAATASLLASAMGAPPGMQEVNGLRNRYLDTYLPPRRKQNRIESEPARKLIKVQFLHEPITDLSIPTTKQVKSVTTEIRKRLESGEKVYMHCWGGRGRAGTLGACLLGDLYGIDAEEALLRVQKAFSTRGDAGASGYGSPETLQQINFVKQYLSRR